MNHLLAPIKKEPILFLSFTTLIIIGLYILNSLSPELFPQYYLYLGISIIIFYIFFFVGFDILKFFSPHLYVFSIFLLVITLVIGQVTRGAVRWIPIGSFAFQASEITRPFIMLLYAKILAEYTFKPKKLIYTILLALIPVILIAIQPSFGVSILTLFGLSVIFVSKVVKGKYIAVIALLGLAIIPLFWFVLQPYQKERLTSFINSSKDPYGSGYNTIQSVISVGSGELWGRGFRKGFQTQLQYLPEKHTDFIFAAISEELGFAGSLVLILLLYFVIYRILEMIKTSKDETYKLFAFGVSSIFLLETIINIGMNLGVFPITGLPLPFVSAGGSSMLASLITVSILISGKSKMPLR